MQWYLFSSCWADVFTLAIFSCFNLNYYLKKIPKKFIEYYQQFHKKWVKILRVGDCGKTNMYIMFQVNLEEQQKAAEKGKSLALEIRVKNIKASVKEKRLQTNNALQPWQHGVIKTTNANRMMYEDLKEKYGIDYVPTQKTNQVKWNTYF